MSDHVPDPQPITSIPTAALLSEVGLWTEADLARALGVSMQTLAAWRCRGEGPAYVKLGKGVFYRPDDIRAWIARSVVTPTVVS